MDRVLGAKTTLDRIGLRPGLCMLEVCPGHGRLLIPAAQRVLPGGEVVRLDIQPGMYETHRAIFATGDMLKNGDVQQPIMLKVKLKLETSQEV